MSGIASLIASFPGLLKVRGVAPAWSAHADGDRQFDHPRNYDRHVVAATLAEPSNDDVDRFEDHRSLDEHLHDLPAPWLRAISRYFARMGRRCVARAAELDAEEVMWQRARAHVADLAKHREANAPPDPRMVRDLEIMRLARRGLHNAEIARRVGASPSTVSRTIARALRSSSAPPVTDDAGSVRAKAPKASRVEPLRPTGTDR